MKYSDVKSIKELFNGLSDKTINNSLVVITCGDKSITVNANDNLSERFISFLKSSSSVIVEIQDNLAQEVFSNYNLNVLKQVY